MPAATRLLHHMANIFRDNSLPKTGNVGFKIEQKLLLRITDLQSAIVDEVSLHSFFAGFRLASCIHRELAQEPSYSFDRDEERCAEAQYLKEQEE